MLLGIDPIIWKHVSYWLGLGADKLSDTIENASIYQFGGVAAVVVLVGFYFMRTQRIG